MKIGVVGCFYNCVEDLDEVLQPWLDLRKNQEITITAVNSLFTEYADMGREDSDEPTRTRLMTKQLDYVHFSPVPLGESQARNECLKYLLSTKVDVIWLLDGDEFYTVDEIREIIYFIDKHKDEKDAFFSINFKNHVFDGVQWVDGFSPPRIFWKDIHGGINQFYWDNDIVYMDGTNYKSLKEIEIPRDVAHIRHMTWLHENGKEKYEYQVKHFGHCSYKWDYEKEKLEFDLDFHEKHNIPIPELKIG